MVDTSDNPVHWRFAAFHAFKALEMQVRCFDFARESGHATYSGLTPSFLLEVIDGFLAENDTIVPDGSRKQLEQLRTLIVGDFLAAFDSGWHEAVEAWNSVGKEYGAMPLDEMHELARKSSPFESTKREWFIEGFSQAWAKAELDSIRPT